MTMAHSSDNPGNGGWKGYSFEELRYRRALNAIRIEVEKQKLLSAAGKFKIIAPLGGRSFLRGAWGNLDKLGYALLALKLARNLLKLRRKSSRR